MENKKSITKNAFYNILYKLLNVLFPLITAAYVSHIIFSEGVGKVAYAQNIASYFAILAALGLPAYGVRIVSRIQNKDELNKNVTEMLIILFSSTIICSIVYYVLVSNVGYFAEERNLYFISGVQVFLVALNVDWFYQGKEEYGYIALRNCIIKIASLIAIFVFVRTKSDYLIYALITSLALVGNYLFNIVRLRKYVSLTFKGLSLKKHLKPVFILLLSTIAIELYSKIDITMLGIMCDDTIVGYYSNSIKLINVLVVAITAVTSVFLPRLSVLYLENKEKFDNLVNIGVEIIFFIALPCCVGLFFVSDHIVLLLYGEDFLLAGKTIKILCPIILIKSIGDLVCYQVVISVGKEKYFIFSNVFVALSNILLNWLFIPIYKQNGAAMASVISEFSINMIMFFVSMKIVRIRLEVNPYVPIIVSSLVMSIFCFLILKIHLNNALLLTITVTGSIIIYFLINVIMKNKIMCNFTKIRGMKNDTN